MDIRSHESPMDFEWQTHGPADESSPFYKLAMSHRKSQDESQAKKRQHSIFDSPSKSSAPALREPASHSYLFSQTPTSKPAPAFRNPSFTTPRKFDTDMFSSGAENPSSPENADNEDTPEQARTTGDSTTLTRFVENKEKKPPLFGKFGASPGRGEVPRGRYTNVIARKIHKRRRRDAEKEYRIASRRSSFESDSEDDQRSRPNSSEGNGPPNTQNGGFLSSIFGFIETHPNLPHVLSFYAQLLLNVFLVFFFIYIVYSFWSTIRSDVDKRSEEVAAETLAEMAVCARNYVDNRCEHSSRVPAMETVCDNWEKCMNKDPNMVGRARVSAHTFAEIFNSFIEPISYKAMIFSLVLVFGCVAISNFAFGFFRNKAHSQTPSTPFMPQTPSHHHYQPDQFYTPYQSRYENGPGPSSMPALGGLQTPRNRLTYR
ncbi:MAG: hypothetical protein M1819_001720 [Sarea resinae]|nr:MAG: hypothetical protein M1819_001720 [Sarea resinae]